MIKRVLNRCKFWAERRALNRYKAWVERERIKKINSEEKWAKRKQILREKYLYWYERYTIWKEKHPWLHAWLINILFTIGFFLKFCIFSIPPMFFYNHGYRVAEVFYQCFERACFTSYIVIWIGKMVSLYLNRRKKKKKET